MSLLQSLLEKQSYVTNMYRLTVTTLVTRNSPDRRRIRRLGQLDHQVRSITEPDQRSSNAKGISAKGYRARYILILKQ